MVEVIEGKEWGPFWPKAAAISVLGGSNCGACACTGAELELVLFASDIRGPSSPVGSASASYS